MVCVAAAAACFAATCKEEGLESLGGASEKGGSGQQTRVVGDFLHSVFPKLLSTNL